MGEMQRVLGKAPGKVSAGITGSEIPIVEWLKTEDQVNCNAANQRQEKQIPLLYSASDLKKLAGHAPVLGPYSQPV